MPNESRSIDVAVDIAASPDAVWNALTDPAELVRWFPLQADVTPGAGGKVKWSWDDKWTWESRIELWEPGRRLRLVQDDVRPFDVEGGYLADSDVGGRPVVMDFTLETIAGRTRLRLVHAGFGYGAQWDDEVDGVTVGWNHELRGLAFYLEKHRGKPRHAAQAYLTWDDSQAATWRKLISPSGCTISAQRLAIGEPYTLEVSTGDRFDGIVQHHVTDRDFTGTVRALDDGLFRIGTHRAAGKTGIQVWVVTYNERHAPQVAAIAARAQGLLDRLFAQQ
ncbi:MAG TPA: SRPBCC domain-containing protein [Gemmatimonadaceae bacterium]|nr:SRPBCC domain-containing protein [Gemmatimonadaceae bacterium]